jgi:hypothetical protein
MENWFNLFPVLLILLAILGMLVLNDWRRNIIAFAALYLGIFILLVQVLPLILSSVLLITGWMSALLLGLNLPKEDSERGEGLLSKRLFRVFSTILIWILALVISKSVSSVFQVSPEIAFSVVAIYGSGLLQLGMKTRPLFVILGILTVFAGFELLYSSIETSVLINGLLSAISLLIAFIGSFFAGNQQREDQS